MKRKVFNRIVCILTAITMMTTPFASLADDLHEQDDGIEMTLDEDQDSDDEEEKVNAQAEDGSSIETDIYEEDVFADEDSDEESSPFLNLEDDNLGAGDGFISDDDVIEIEGDVKSEEGTEIFGEASITFEDVELQAGEEVFPENSTSETIIFDSGSLDAEMPDRSEFEDCHEILIGDVGQENNSLGHDLEFAASNTSMTISPSDLKVIRGCTGTVFIDIKNLNQKGTLYARIKGDGIMSLSWGKIDNSNGLRVPVYIKGEKNGIADICFDLINPDTNVLICTAYLHITVYDGPRVYSSAAAVDLRQGGSYNARISISGVYEDSCLQFGVTNDNVIRCQWGKWNSATASAPLNISGIAPGEGTVTVYLKSSPNGVTYASVSIKVRVTSTAKVTVSVPEISLMAGSEGSIDITVSNCSGMVNLICSSTNEAAYTLEWGRLNGTTVTLKIKGNKAGSGTVCVYLKDSLCKETLAQTSFKVNVSQPQMSFTKDVSLTVGEEQTINVVVTGIAGNVTISKDVSNAAICSCEFGRVNGNTVPVIIKGQNEGTAYVNLLLTDSSGNKLCSGSIKVNVSRKSNPQVVVGKSSVEVSVGNSVVVPVSCRDVYEDVAFICELDSNCFSVKWADAWRDGAVNLAITGGAEGSGTIKLRMINRKNETLAYGSINVSVKSKELSVSDISYQFPNIDAAADERICKYMYSGVSWKSVYAAELGNGGNCYGMSTTAGMFYVPSNGVDVSLFGASMNRIGELHESDKSAQLDLTVREFVQAMQITQASTIGRKNIVSDLDYLIQNVDNEVKNGRPVEISIRGEYHGTSEGHSILAIGTQRINASTTWILVYDNNDPNETRHISISRDSNGKAISWSYDFDSNTTWGGRNGDDIFYMNYTRYYNLWANRGELITGFDGFMAINSKDFTVYDVYDYPVAVMKNGEFISEDENIYKVIYEGITRDEDQTDSDYYLIHMPVDLYTIKNTDKSIDELDLTFTNIKHGVEVTTKADEVILCADDRCDLAAVMINDCDQKDYSITLMKSDDKGEIQTIEISGLGQADVVSAALDSGNLETGNVEGSNIVISDGADIEKHVSDITFDKYYKEIIEGDKFTISATVTPSDAVDAKVSWSSTNEAVATVDDNGCVEAVAEGYATIVAKAGGITTSCSVNVITKGSRPLPADKVHVTSISFNETNVSLKPGQSKQLEVTITPEDATNKKLSWASDNEGVVTVSDNGVITAVSEGQATITVTSVDNGNVKASCIVTVSQVATGGSATDPQPCIDETTTELTLVKGQKFVLTEKDWKSSDNKVVNVNKGKVTVKKDGKAELSRDGQTINVTVLAPSFDAKSVKMISGQEKSIVLNNTGDLEVLYLSNAPDVAAVSEDGEITALSKGSAVINAYVNGVVYKYTVKVADVDTSKRDFSKTVELVPMQTVSVKIQGFNAKKAVWSSASQVSENEIPKGYVFADSVVKISRSGKLTAIGYGETTLTATGGSDTPITISIVVSEPVEKTLHLNLKSTKTLKMYGVKGYLDWNIEDNTIVEVSKNKVTPKAAGSTELTAQYEGFSYKVTVYVEDIALATDDRLTGKSNKYSVSMKTGDTIELLPVKVYQPMIFKSNKSEVAYADEDGLLTARSAGTAKLTAKVNGKTVTVTVKVTD